MVQVALVVEFSECGDAVNGGSGGGSGGTKNSGGSGRSDATTCWNFAHDGV